MRGGPLVVPDGQGGHVQVGVVSFGEGCGRPNKFGVYARLAQFQPWIASHIGAAAAPLVNVPSTPPRETAETAAETKVNLSTAVRDRETERASQAARVTETVRIPETVRSPNEVRTLNAVRAPVVVRQPDAVSRREQRDVRLPAGRDSTSRSERTHPPRIYIPHGWGWKTAPR